MLSRLTRFAALAAFVATPAVAADPPPAPAAVSYYRDVRPVFLQHCQGCHQPAKAGGGYVMTEFAAVLKAGESGKPAVVPGKPAASALIEQVTAKGKDGHALMPKNRDPLKPVEVERIAAWITAGAADDTPAAAKSVLVDAAHPPAYAAAPVVTAVAFAPDGTVLAVTGYHEIVLHHADGRGVAARLVGASERVQSLAFSPDGKLLAAAAGDPGRGGEVQVWDVTKRKLRLSAPATFDTIYGLSWSPDGTKIAFGCGDNTVRVVDADSGKQVLFMGTHSDWVVGTVFSRDGLHLASVSRDMTLKLTEVPTQRFVDNVTSITPGALKGGLMAVDRRPLKEQKMAPVPKDTPNAAAKVYDELLCAGADGTPRLYKMHRETPRVIGDDANRIKVFDAMPGRVSAVKFAPDGDRFAAASSLDGAGAVRVYDVASGKAVPCEKVTGPAYTVAWAPDGKAIASAGFDGRVWLHDPATGKLVKEFVAVPLTTIVTTKVTTTVPAK